MYTGFRHFWEFPMIFCFKSTQLTLFFTIKGLFLQTQQCNSTIFPPKKKNPSVSSLAPRYDSFFNDAPQLCNLPCLFTLLLKVLRTFSFKFLLFERGHPSNSFDLTFIFSLCMRGCCDQSLVEKLKDRRKILIRHFLISVINIDVEPGIWKGEG